MATLLSTVQRFAQGRGLQVPPIVVGSLDTQVIQMRGLLQEGGDDWAVKGAWQTLTNEASWSTTATENQGALTTLAPNGFYGYILPYTLWSRTQKLPLLGPASAKEWQFLKAVVITGPRFTFRERGGNFIVTPAPPAANTWVFEYLSENWILAANGTTYKKVFTSDDDTILLPDQVVLADLRWRWRQEKGLEYAEDFNKCERIANDILGRDGALKKLDMSARPYEPKPGIFIPPGSWLL